MPGMVSLLVALGLGYLSGSLPWGLWLGRWLRGVDVRTLGSRNLGATKAHDRGSSGSGDVPTLSTTNGLGNGLGYPGTSTSASGDGAEPSQSMKR